MENINKGIVICSHVNNENILNNCIDSIIHKCYPYRIYVVINGVGEENKTIGSYRYLKDDRFELGAINEAVNTFNLDEFVLLQDTIEIKNTSLFDITFGSEYENKTVYYFHRFMCYAGKYRKEILDKIGIPVVTTKFDSVIQEDLFHKKYFEADTKSVCLFPELNDTYIFEEKFGRKNMIIENSFLKKYKGTWNLDMVKR